MAKKNNNTPKNTSETNSNDLLNIFDETSKIDDIDQRIHITENQIIEKQNMLINKAIAEGNIKKAKELLDVFQQNISKDNDDAKYIYRQLKNKINEKIVDQKLQEAITFYDTGSFANAKTLLHEVNPITIEQENIRDKYSILLKEKQKEIEKQQELADIQQLFQIRKDFPNILLTKPTAEIQEQLNTFEKIFKPLSIGKHNAEHIKQFENFPSKEIYEALQKSYMQENMTAFEHIKGINHPFCTYIRNYLIEKSTTHNRTLTTPKKFIDQLLGIHRPFLGMGSTIIDPFDTTRFEKSILSLKGIRDANTFLDDIREKCIAGSGFTTMDSRSRQTSRDKKYIDMMVNNQIRSRLPNMKTYIDQEGLDVSSISTTSSGKGIHKLKEYLKGKQITSWKANDGSRWLEVIN